MKILLSLMLFGAYFIAFAEIREEDEFSNQLLLESMIQAIVYNSILLLLLKWFFYDGLFLFVLISQLFSYLISFIILKETKAKNNPTIIIDPQTI